MMNKLLFFVCALSLFSYSSAVYLVNSGIACSSTAPAPGSGSGWLYCVDLGLYLHMSSCATLSGFQQSGGYHFYCSTTLYYFQNPINNREVEEPESEVSIDKRATYAECPVTGQNWKVCCPSPKTCHTGNTPATVCY